MKAHSSMPRTPRVLIWSILLASASGCGDGSGPGRSPRPQEYYVAFPANLDLVQSAEQWLRIVGSPGITGSIAIPDVAVPVPFIVDGTGLVLVDVPASAMLNAWDTVMARAVVVQSTDSVNVIAVSDKPSSMHAATVMPAKAGDTVFTVMSGGTGAYPGSFLVVVARQGATSVTITPTATAGARTAGSSFTIVMNAGEAYQLQSTSTTNDLSGTLIRADKPISVFGGHLAGRVPSNECCVGFLWTSIPAHASVAGTDFIALPLSGRSAYRLRVLALQPNTNLTSTGIAGFAASLDPGQIVEGRTTTAARVTSDKPILLAQLAEGYGVDGAGTDPCLTLIPPVPRFTRAVDLAAPRDQAPARFVNVVVSTASASSVRLNDSVPNVTFTAIGTTGYSGAAIPISRLVNRVSAGAEFGALVYGWDTVPGANGFCYAPYSAF